MFKYAPSVKINRKVTEWLLLCLYINVYALDLRAYNAVSSIPATQPRKYMIITLQTHEIVNRLLSDSNCWSRAGAFALAQHLQDWEISTGEQMEFDAVAIRCDFAEYPTAVAAYNDITRGHDLTEEEEEIALERLRDVGQVIEFDGGIIISN